MGKGMGARVQGSGAGSGASYVDDGTNLGTGLGLCFEMVAEVGIAHHDLLVMSQASCFCSTPRQPLSYFNFKPITINTLSSIIAFDTMIGKLKIMDPYTNHKTTPIANDTSQVHDILCVNFVLNVLITCGMKETVVKVAATNPKISTNTDHL